MITGARRSNTRLFCEEGPILIRILTSIAVAVLCFIAVQRASLHHASLVVIVTSNDGVVLASESMGISSDGTVELYNQQKIFPISTKSALVITGVSGYPREDSTLWLQDAISNFVENNRIRLVNAELDQQTRMVSDFIVKFLEENFLTLSARHLPDTNEPIVMFVIVSHNIVRGKGGLRLHRFWYSKSNHEIGLEVQSSPVVKDRSTVVAFGSGGRAFDMIVQELFFGKERKYEQLRTLPLVQRIKKATRRPSINSIYVPLSDGPDLCEMIIQYAIDHWKEYENGRRTIGGPIKIAIITPLHGFQWVN